MLLSRWSSSVLFSIPLIVTVVGCGSSGPQQDTSLGSAFRSTAIIDGSNDAGTFPEVCTLTWRDPADPSGPRFSLCSGVLLSPTVLLSAGHCGFLELWGVVESPKVACDGTFQVGVSKEVSGHFGIIPSMDPDNNLWDPDVAVFLLDEPIVRMRYGQLPDIEQVGDIYAGTPEGKGAAITLVGYGANQPDITGYPRIPGTGTRRVTANRYSSLDSLFLWGSAAPGHGYVGDSGGPAYLAKSKVVLGITILGSDNLTGLGRMDRSDVQALHPSVPEARLRLLSRRGKDRAVLATGPPASFLRRSLRPREPMRLDSRIR